MEIIYLEKALEDLKFWKKHNTKLLQKIAALMESINANPYKGIGKPEALKFDKRDFWSRRIDKEHRIIYLVTEDKIYIYSLKGLYE